MRKSRRRMLQITGGGIFALLPGCNSSNESTTTTPSSTESQTATSTPSETIASTTERATDTPTKTTDIPTETPRENPNTIFVDGQNGRNYQPGTEDEPLATIQQAFQQAMPGEEIVVAPGEYREGQAPNQTLHTVRDGRPDAPITIRGPEEAVVKGQEIGPALRIKNSHIHLRGLTIDGLLDPSKPEVADSYSRNMLLHCRPPMGTDEYLENIVCAPNKIGNSHRPLMLFERTKDLEIGPLQVSGVAGARYVYGDNVGHVGEIIYLGQPPGVYEKEWYEWDEIDQTRDVHIHHIDNSAGHAHSELVNAKPGTRNVLIEYCTDAGGSQNTEDYSATSIRLESYDATVRWCDLRDGQGYAFHLPADTEWLEERNDPEVSPSDIGTGHSIYGNRVEGFGDYEFVFDFTGPDAQEALCDNKISNVYVRPPSEGEEVDSDPSKSCPAELPSGDGVGHTGGDSPYE